MKDEPRLSGTEQAILQLMLNLGGERYGKELVEASGGFLKQRSIYVFLSRMEEKGFISSRTGDPTEARGVPRKYFKMTGLGRRVLDSRTSIGARWENV
jgi:DNA-binding PadR family transcriptional regulator